MATKAAKKSRKPAPKKSARKAPKKAPKDETPAERAAREAEEAEETRTTVREAEARGEPTKSGSLPAATGGQGRATGETTLIDRRTMVTYQPIARPGSSVPLLEETLGQASNEEPKREPTETRVVGARVEGEKNVVVTILPGSKEAEGKAVAKTNGESKDSAKKHGELHVAQKDTLNPDNLDLEGTFTPRQEGARDVDFAVASKVEPDPIGAGRTGAGA